MILLPVNTEYFNVYAYCAARHQEAPPHEVYVPRRPPPAEYDARRPSRDRHAPAEILRGAQYLDAARAYYPGRRVDGGGDNHAHGGRDSNPGEVSREERCELEPADYSSVNR